MVHLYLTSFIDISTFIGNPSNYYVQSAGNFSEQLVGDVAMKRRSVAGVDKEDLVDLEKLADPDSLFFEINGVRVHHKICHHEANEEDKEEAIRGKIGLPMIFLHGFGASIFSWGQLMKPLAWLIGSKVLAFDRPVFGLRSRTSYIKNKESGAGDDKPLNPYSTAFSVLAMLSFVHMLGARKAILMGHSTGCLVALNAHFESPEQVAALILVAPAIFAPLIMNSSSHFRKVTITLAEHIHLPADRLLLFEAVSEANTPRRSIFGCGNMPFHFHLTHQRICIYSRSITSPSGLSAAIKPDRFNGS